MCDKVCNHTMEIRNVFRCNTLKQVIDNAQLVFCNQPTPIQLTGLDLPFAWEACRDSL